MRVMVACASKHGATEGIAEAIAAEQVEWCERRLLARIHRRTLDGLRRLIEPVSPAVLLRFLLSWQHARPATQQHGRDGLLRVIERLQGFEIRL